MAAKKPTLEQLDDFLSPAISLPIRGKKYRIEAVGMKTGLQLQKQMDDIQNKINAGVPMDEIELVSDGTEDYLGDAEAYFRKLVSCYDDMVKDDLPMPAVQEAAAIVMLWTVSGFAAAKEYYDAGGKAQAPNRGARRTGTRTRQAAANTTQPQDYQSSTKRNRAGNGRTSSPTGKQSKATSTKSTG